jgi:hypothetical protein
VVRGIARATAAIVSSLMLAGCSSPAGEGSKSGTQPTVQVAAPRPTEANLPGTPIEPRGALGPIGQAVVGLVVLIVCFSYPSLFALLALYIAGVLFNGAVANGTDRASFRRV